MKNQVPEQENKTQNQSQPVAVSSDGKNVNTIRVDSRIIPIYPVRYAYANFFEEELSEPVEPPELKSFIGSPDIKTTKGYIIRLLREGWVYIREEDDPANGQFHIFKYERIIGQEGKVTERFPKYTFKNKINAQDGIQLDKSGQRPEGYPFVFVSSKSKKISIVYSEHEWHPDVIDKMHSSESERRQSMQLIDLEAETGPHSVKADAANLKKLIDEYRKRKDKLLDLKDHIKDQGYAQDEELGEINLSVLTTEESYEMDAGDIAFELRKKTARNKNAKIVALFDPVGRQREIVEVHSRLIKWQNDFIYRNIYPFHIGQFVQQLSDIEDEDVKKIIKKSINWEQYNKFWNEMNKDFEGFGNRQTQFARLYKDFMFGTSAVGKIGSLDTYFHKFFCREPEGDVNINAEFQKLCEIGSSIYSGITASAPLEKALEEIISDAAEQQELAEPKNAWGAYFKLFIGYTTTPNPAPDMVWTKSSIYGLDKLLEAIGPLLGKLKVYSWKGIKNTKTKLSKNSVRYVSENLVPGVLKVFGLEFDTTKKYIQLTDEEFGRVIEKINKEIVQRASVNAQAMSKNIMKNTNPLRKAMDKVKRGQKIFDWTKHTGGKIVWKLPKINVIGKPGNNKYLRHIKTFISNGSLIFDVGLPGLSAYINIMSISEVMAQTGFSKANPINYGNRYHSMAKFVQATTALTQDIAIAGRYGSLGAVKLLSNSRPLALSLAPRITGAAQYFGRFLATKMLTRFVVAANIAGAVASGFDAYNAFKAGNKRVGQGHTMIVLGSVGMICGHALIMAGGAGGKAGAAAGSTGVGVIIGGFIIALSLLAIGIGMFLVHKYKKSHFQALLENCFWGNGDKYVFWSSEDERPDLDIRLKRALMINEEVEMMIYYQMELHEFMNTIYMPGLEIEKVIPDKRPVSWYKRAYTYKFTLPGFQKGESQLEAEVFSHYSNPSQHTVTVSKERSSEYYTEQLCSMVEKVIQQEKNGYAQKDGVTEITVSLETETDIDLYWNYQPQKDMIVPLRLITENGVLQESIKVAGMVNERPM